VQGLRQKREAIDGAASDDAWALHVAERSMLGVIDPNAGPLEAAWPKVAPVEAPAACVDQRIEDNVSEYATDSQDAAFETWLSEQPWNRGSRGSGEPDLRAAVREAMAESRLGAGIACARSRESREGGLWLPSRRRNGID
jgi:hypothetical protein